MSFSGLISALPAIAVLAMLIVVHELGHFMAARLQGIYANKFSIGFGPILWKYQGPETEYALRAFPLGGFVGFPDDDPEQNNIDPNDPNLLRNRPLLDRAIVISAGVIANLIFAYLILVLQVGIVGTEQASQPGVLVSGLPLEVVNVDAVAGKAGIQVGDKVFIQRIPADFDLTKVDSKVLFNDSRQFTVTYDDANKVAELFTTAPGQETKIVVDRKDADDKIQRTPFTITPQASVNGKGITGIQVKPTVAIRAGMQPGDVVVEANGRPLGQELRTMQSFQGVVRESANKPVELKVQRDGAVLPVTVIPEANKDNDGIIGVSLSLNGKAQRQRVGGLAVFSEGAEQFQNIVVDTLNGFGMLISRFNKMASQVAGPVAIVAVGAQIAQSDAASLFQFAALISINLAIINILPLPALDGGHLTFLLIEGLRGKPLPSKVQDGVMQTGLMLLLGLGIFLIIRDTANLFPGIK
jgi:RIP metalloprotease RseP